MHICFKVDVACCVESSILVPRNKGFINILAIGDGVPTLHNECYVSDSIERHTSGKLIDVQFYILWLNLHHRDYNQQVQVQGI